MSLKHKLMPYVARLITSESLQQLRRRLREWRRVLRRQPHQATFYFRIDDPYSVLMAQVLPRFARHFGITITPRVMLYLDQQMYPAADMLEELAPRDALQLAELHELTFPKDWQLPPREVSLAATRCLLKHEGDERFWSLAAALADALWRHDHDKLETLLCEHGQMAADRAQLALEARRDQFLADGHYLTGTLHYQGEWYWSVERLAREAALSRTGFAERFALRLGMTPMAYVTAWRMQIAREALASRGISVAEAAEISGYASESAFSRVFKKEIGLSPAAYRQSCAQRQTAA